MYTNGFEQVAAIPPPRARLKEYLAIARFDHATKHVFILPGIVVAYALRDPPMENAAVAIAVGLLSAVAIASANYVLNEWLDREFDAFHPTKRTRSAVVTSLVPHLVYLEYFVLASIGVLLAAAVGTSFFYTSVIFLISGLTYNVKPFRSKDLPYLDVISEFVNNPIRLTLGWTMIDHVAIPPASLLLAYWAAGAFLMGAKRLSEYRDIVNSGNMDLLQRYRRSFRLYTAESLTVSCFLYAMMSAFAIAVFLTRYRLEYILALPFIAILFASYLWLSLLKNSIAQRPERMFRSRRLMASLILAVMAIFILSFVDLPWLYDLSAPNFTPVDMQ